MQFSQAQQQCYLAGKGTKLTKTAMTVLPGWKGDLTDRGQGIDVLPQLFKLFSWTEYATIFLLLFTLEKFYQFNSSSHLTNGCQLLRICCKVISITSSSLPAEKKYIKQLDMSPLSSTRTHVSSFIQPTFCNSF